MQVLPTIIPIFAVVILGWYARKKGFIPQTFLAPANRLVYYFSIPALIFRYVAKASFVTEFNLTVLNVTLASAVVAYCTAWLLGHLTRWRPERIGTFIQCSAHGNAGYIGLPIAFYYMGESGFVKASILAGFLMVLQNVMSVFALQAHAVVNEGSKSKYRIVAEKLVRNPVIVSAMAGMAASIFQLTLHPLIDRFLEIMGGLAPPMSLLLIGASISVQVMRKNLFPVFGAVIIKIIALPVLGLTLFLMLDVAPADYIPGMILLATPTATVAYVMSKEMQGDDEFAVAAISTSTLFSALTYSIWLVLVTIG